MRRASTGLVRILWLLVALVACQLSPAGPGLRIVPAPAPLAYPAPVRHKPVPRGVPAVATYTASLVELRTTLGRAGIGLEVAGVEMELRTSECHALTSARGECSRCVLVAGSDDFALDLGVLAAIKAAFDRYPTAVLDATRIAHVALCTKLIDEDGHEIYGTVDPRAHRMLVSVAAFLGKRYVTGDAWSAENVVHHELFHLFEYEHLHAQITGHDSAWSALNPADFVYRKPAPGEARTAGFVNVYATTNANEDRASVFELVMAQPDALCRLAATDEGVRNKARLIWQRVAAVVDDQFLRRRAACVVD